MKRRRVARCQREASSRPEELNMTICFSPCFEIKKESPMGKAVPPYVIFSDKTLVEMATYFPQGRESLLNISGVGKVKFERYGAAFLEIIKEYCSANKIDEKYKAPAREQG
jgi:superfamily II DNA helicase RecQ